MSECVIFGAWVHRAACYLLGANCLAEYLRQAEIMGPVKLAYGHVQSDGRFAAEIYVHAGYFLGVLVPEIEKIEAEYSVVVDVGSQFTVRSSNLRRADNREVSAQLIRRMPVGTRIRVELLVSESVEDAEKSNLQVRVAPDEAQTFLNFHNED